MDGARPRPAGTGGMPRAGQMPGVRGGNLLGQAACGNAGMVRILRHLTGRLLPLARLYIYNTTKVCRVPWTDLASMYKLSVSMLGWP